MNTPIYDFVRRYADSDAIRAHMPGHKGRGALGCEALDLTEITGADELYAPEGIIAESEANASALFGCRTLYSAEGSSLCIRAMLYLAMRWALAQGRKPVIAAARNAHRSFLTAAVLLDLEVIWLPPDPQQSYLASGGADTWKSCLDAPVKPCALYLTSPDYLGSIADIRAAAEFCHANDMLLLVDNAHGAYLQFLPESLHPSALGADLSCDSAHKTLPVLTGGAYLHIHDDAPEICSRYAKNAMALFGSTSPSWLILTSLDLCNACLGDAYIPQMREAAGAVAEMKKELLSAGWRLFGREPLKLTLQPKLCGYTGTELAAILQEQRIFVEFADPDHTVLMLSPKNSPSELAAIRSALLGIPMREPISTEPPEFSVPPHIFTPRQAVFYCDTEILPTAQCIGRICAEFAVACPPAVPVVICGERITAAAAACMQYYGIEKCSVVKSNQTAV
ncbi:MAG: amino acid decarboxylase [Oscillospiraceae bacterium]|nr:amino acid decarboxylase [Oscillospiraceae bacterium]